MVDFHKNLVHVPKHTKVKKEQRAKNSISKLITKVYGKIIFLVSWEIKEILWLYKVVVT